MKIAIWVLTLALAACGASARDRAIATALTTTNAAALTFEKWDALHQGVLVAKAPDYATGKAELAQYRLEQTKVAQLLAGAYRAIATAATLEDDHSLLGVAQAALLLQDELQALKVMP